MELNNHSKKYIIYIIYLIPFLLGSGIDLYVPSLPAITNYFQTTTQLVQLTIGLYMLGYAIGQVFLGVLSDSLGRKKILMVSMVIYILISFSMILSPNIYFLIIGRILQGAAIAGPAVVMRAIITDCFSGLELTKVMTQSSISWGLGPIIGPLIGGYLQYLFNWQADFLFFGLYGLIILVFAGVALPETHRNLMPLHIGTICQTIKTIITHPLFMIFCALASLAYSSLVIFNIVAPFLIQIDLKYSVIAYGHIALILGFGYFLGNVSNRVLVNYFPPMRLVFFSIILAIVISFIMILLSILTQLNIYSVVIPAIILFWCSGIIFPNMMATSAKLFPHVAGTASAIYGSWVAAGVFIMSCFATLLKTNTLTPLAITYFIVSFVFIVLYILGEIFKRRLNINIK